MPKPVTVSVDVEQDVEAVYAFLDVMANHEGFNDHLMKDWEFSGPARGVGAKARVRTKVFGVSDVVDFEVVDAEAPTRIVEVNVAAKAGRTGQGTYVLERLAAGGTRISFEYRWLVTPLGDKLLAPLVRSFMRRNNQRSMQRLAGQLVAAGPAQVRNLRSSGARRER
jgi:Polyketide cyclase / dehydrase and lipid transport